MPSRYQYERAIRRSELPSLARLIALTLATWADSKSGRIAPGNQPSLSTLKESTGMSHASVLKQLGVLEKGGWVERHAPSRSEARSQKVSTKYRLRLPDGVAIDADASLSSRSPGDLDESDMRHLSRSPGDLDKPGTRSPGDLDERDKQEGVRNALGHEVTTRVFPTSPLPPPTPEEGVDRTEPGREDSNRIPNAFDYCQPLIRAMTDAGIVVSWQMTADDWQAVARVLERAGTKAMVTFARDTKADTRKPIRYATFFLRGWTGLPPATTARDSPQPAIPWCKDPDCDEITRTREIEDARGLRTAAPCPRCHPSRKEPAA